MKDNPNTPLKIMEVKHHRRGFHLKKENTQTENKSFGRLSKTCINLASLEIPNTSHLDNLQKRKEAQSPGLPKKKPFRKVALPFLLLSNHSNNGNHPIPAPETPSAFESEFADQENQSPNDPDFIRRTSFRWKRKCGMSNADNLNLLSQNRNPDVVIFQWPTYPCQQPSQKFVSCMSNSHDGTEQHSCLPAMYNNSADYMEQSASISVHSHSKLVEPSLVDNMTVEQSLTPERTNNIRKSSKKPPSFKCQKVGRGNSLDDSITEAVKKQAQREQTRKTEIAVRALLGHLHLGKNQSHENSRTFSFKRTHNSSHSLSSTVSNKNLSHLQSTSKLTSLSCHSGLSTWGYGSSTQLNHHNHPTSEDIFLMEPAIAEKFAIMFPSEPRPEWHRHLRQVLHKAGQKIFKKPEHHDTTIPENLRYQLKQIYVY